MKVIFRESDGVTGDRLTLGEQPIADGQYLIRSGRHIKGISTGPGGLTGLANPTGLIGLSAVNGSATTATRSDGRHALDQGIEPTWTSDHRWGTNKKINFRDTAIGIYSQADTFLDVFADGGTRIGNSSSGAPTSYT